MTAYWVTGDTRDVVAQIPDGTVDLVVTSPPFLALRSYLPADHPDKHREIGSEATPAAFTDTLLGLSAEWRRVLAPHGSMCVELGDTYSGSGGAGGDYNDGGLRDRQQAFSGSARAARTQPPNSSHRLHPDGSIKTSAERRKQEPKALAQTLPPNGGPGWPDAKCLSLIPELYRIGLAYGINPITGQPSPAGRWKVRNVIRWVRPNPPVGALGDKFRCATSDMVVACISGKRWFDLDAVRTASDYDRPNLKGQGSRGPGHDVPGQKRNQSDHTTNPAGAPPLDWWQISPGGYSGKTTSKRRERVPAERAFDGGVERTTSPDCPVHADLPGQLPKALRDAHAAEQSRRTPHTDGRLDLGQEAGSVPSDEIHGLTGSSPPPTSATTPPECAPAATSRSTAVHRTALAPATTPAGTPSAETTHRTDGTSTSHASAERHPGTSESRTSEDGLVDPPSSETDLHTADRDKPSPDSGPCTCSFWRTITESTSHYAVFPAELVVRPIEAMCPRRVCRTCGTPSSRITHVEQLDTGRTTNGPQSIERKHLDGGSAGFATRTESLTTTLGWSSCGCPGTEPDRLDGYHTDTGWRPGRVLDPFAGSGTTGVVATGHSRDFIGIDLDERNHDLALDRIGAMFLQHIEATDLAGILNPTLAGAA